MCQTVIFAVFDLSDADKTLPGAARWMEDALEVNRAAAAMADTESDPLVVFISLLKNPSKFQTRNFSRRFFS